MNHLSASKSVSPLASPQRETSGAQTFEKYEYQYHWALCRILNAHESLTDYVVFIELHEDVVFADSTDETLAQFEFNQVKNVSGSTYTVKKLTSRYKGKKAKEKNSVLGKMLLGVNDKPFRDKIHALSLVATCGFNLALKKGGLSLSVISVGDLHADCLEAIHLSMVNEIGKDQKLPDMLTFVRPDLPATEFQDTTIGRIAKLINTKSGMKCSAEDIYLSLIDDLHRKGAVAFDFLHWDTVVKHKGLTYSDVEKVISIHSENKGIDSMMADFDDIVKDKGLMYHEKTRLKRAFERYHSDVHLGRTLLALDIQQEVKKAVEDHYAVFDHAGAIAFIKAALPALSDSVTANLPDPTTAEAALIYELISKNHEI